MTWHSTLYNLALLCCFIYAWLRGGAPERLAAAIMIVGSFLTLLAYSTPSTRFSSVETTVFVVDLTAWACFVAVALRFDRYWTLCVAGLQAAGLLVHVAKAVTGEISGFAYAVGMAFWAYGMLAAIVVGTWRYNQRKARQLLLRC